MKIQRKKLLVDPPAMATGDIAFILIVFFLICASVQPERGKPQAIPKSEEQPEKKLQTKNVEVSLTRTNILINGNVYPEPRVVDTLRRLLASKRSESERVILLKSSKDTEYQRWITVTQLIEDAGGIVTLQIEEEQTIMSN